MNTHNMFYGEIQILMLFFFFLFFFFCLLIYHQMPSLSASLDQIQKLGTLYSILFIS